jgi:hypothetical protein
MPEIKFLEKLATELCNNFPDFANITIVLPNKRAKVFLIDALRERSTQNMFAPSIVSIEDFVQEVAGIRALDNIELLFEFYQIYFAMTDSGSRQPFELFANWAKTLLQDFNEIDRYLLDPRYVLSYLKDIEDIKKWGIEVENKTELLEKYIDFWKLLPAYYEALYNHLLKKGKGYQGLIYREAVRNLEHFSSAVNGKYIFAGFNALNAAEEKIIQHLLSIEAGIVYWDIDTAFLENPYHDAGLFIRRFIKSWPHYKNNAFDWRCDDFAQPKNIRVIGTPKSVGQAKITGSLIKEILDNNPQSSLRDVAIVLGEESLMLPVLYSLPAQTGPLNITMGYSAKNNPAQILIAKLFKLHTNAISRNPGSYVMYYKDVLDILTHPLVEPYASAAELVRVINRNNYTFITHHRLMELAGERNPFFLQLFAKWETRPLAVLESLSSILITIKNHLNNDVADERIVKAFVYAVFKVINKLSAYYADYAQEHTIETLYAIYKQVVDLAEVSFEGEPLSGLQIMGVLESRVLDFDTVIVTSMNEGKFPAGKSQNSFIPYDVKREIGLPTYKEKDAIYTYHFYHLLQRAKNVILLYNTESEGIDGGEKSRFITQLEVEKQPLHTLTHEIYNAKVPEVAAEPIVIPKTPAIMDRLRDIADAGFSPSALTSYIRNPLDFYYKKILRISDADEVEESIALNTLGTIIHETLRALYEPFIGMKISSEDVKSCIPRIDDEVLKQFRLVYREGEIRKGRNLLAFEVAKRNVLNFLRYELQELENDEVTILALETTFERTLNHPALPFPVKIRGNVDRIEQRNGTIRIVDYKTGKVELRDVSLKEWDGLVSDIKNEKIIQVLAYGFMYAELAAGLPLEVGIISFKNMKNGFLPFSIKEEKASVSLLSDVIIEQYINQLVVLLNEILDETIPFTEKV